MTWPDVFDAIPNFCCIISLLLLSKLVAGEPKHYQVSEVGIQCIQTVVVVGQSSVSRNVSDQDHLPFIIREADVALAPQVQHGEVVDGLGGLGVDIAVFEGDPHHLPAVPCPQHRQNS